MTLREGDLFDLANSLAELLGAPVTIEDQDTIVVAYSGGDQSVDEARIGTILARQVPLQYREAIAAAGIFEHLENSDDVVVVDLPQMRMTPRAVVAVRSGGRLLGSVWAAVQAAPTEQQISVLTSAVPLIARHLQRERELADEAGRRRGETMTALLGGGELALVAAAEHGLGSPLTVAAMRGTAADPPTHLLGSLTLHLAAVAPNALCAQLGDTVYAVLDGPADRPILGDFLGRSRHGTQVAIGIGAPASSASSLDDSRSEADQVVQSLVRRGDLGRLADLREVFADLMVDRVSGFVAAHAEASPLAALQAYDREHGAQLVDAARAYLDAGGDIADAATRLHVHPNTMRNRLRRSRETCGVDLDDGDTRLAVMMHLRALPFL